MGLSKRRVLQWLLALLTLSAINPAAAQETLTNAYDPRGRLIAVGHCGSVNSGAFSNYGYDPADNRSSVVANTAAGAAALTLNPTGLPTGSVGIAYSQTVGASGGSGGFSYTVSAGALPTGLSLISATGLISGTPSTAGTYSFTIRATDCVNDIGTRAYSVTINPATLTLNPTTLPNDLVGRAYSQTVTATGGTAPYTYTLSSGSLPDGLSLNNSTGVISGTPSTAGNSYTFTIAAADSASHAGSRSYTMSSKIGLSPASLPGGAVGAAYNQALTATGGSGGYTYTVSAGTLPTGVTLTAATGVISGTTSTAGTYTFTVKVVDQLNDVGSGSYTVPVTLAVGPASLPGATFGSAYSATITASGGSGGYHYAVSSGSLPGGISLSSTGTLSGTPTAAGTSNFTVTATDSAGNSGTGTFKIVTSLALGPTTLANASVGSSYSQALTATGGTAPYGFSLSDGTLPPNLYIPNPYGTTIQGYPTAAGTYSFTLGGGDSAGHSGSRAYSLTVNLGLSPVTMPGATVGVAYNQQVTASGGSGSYTYTVGSGLPPGLSLNGAGLLSGTPTTAGTYNFSVNTSDTAGNIGSQLYGMIIGASGTCGGAAYSVADASTTEGSPLSFAVLKGGSTNTTCTVHYATLDGTGVAGTNYIATSGTLSFTASQNSQTVQVSTIDDGDYSIKSVNMYLDLSAPSGGATVTDPSATGVIKNADPNPCPTC